VRWPHVEHWITVSVFAFFVDFHRMPPASQIDVFPPHAEHTSFQSLECASMSRAVSDETNARTTR
jgi:hypothetical protein